MNAKIINAVNLFVDYTAKAEELVSQFGFVHNAHRERITEKNFPSKDKQEHLVAILVQFDEDLSIEAAATELDKLGLRPANVHELLTLGVQHPDLDRIATIGQLFDDGKDVGIPEIWNCQQGHAIWLNWRQIVEKEGSCLAFVK